MIERPKVVALVAALSLAGLGLLYVYASTMQPIYLSLADVGPEHAGKLVEVSGVVTDARMVRGAVLLTLVDDKEAGSIVVVLEAALAADGGTTVPGDRISARGVVEMYGEQPQIVPSSKEHIVILERENPLRPTPKALVSSISLYRGLVVEVTGAVSASWAEDGASWIVLDVGEGIFLAVKLGDGGDAVSGEEVVFTGTVEFDDTRGWWYIAPVP